MTNLSALAPFKKWIPLLILVLCLGLLATCASPVSSQRSASGSGGATGLTLNLATANIVVGGHSLQLTTSTPSVAWTSSNPNVASVSATGLVAPLSKGQTTITASDGSSTVTCEVSCNILLLWGNVQTAGGPLPVYWLDNVMQTLPVGTGTQIYGSVDNTMVVGTDIYMGGHLTDSTSSTYTPVYWKNGVLNVLPVPQGLTYTGDWIQPSMSASGTLYFRGAMHYQLGADWCDSLGEWVNGTWTALNMTLPDGTVATQGRLNGEFGDPQGNMSFVGSLADPNTGLSMPVYWTGIPGTVTTVSVGALTPYGGYVTAMIGPPVRPKVTLLLAGYNPNGTSVGGYSVHDTVVPLPVGPSVSGVMWWAFTDRFGDTYATGNAGPATTAFWTKQFPAYWKNWKTVSLPLPNGYYNGAENGAYQDSTGTLYFTGQVWNPSSNIPVYWIDGAIHLLPIGTNLGGSGNGCVIGISF